MTGAAQHTPLSPADEQHHEQVARGEGPHQVRAECAGPTQCLATVGEEGEPTNRVQREQCKQMKANESILWLRFPGRILEVSHHSVCLRLHLVARFLLSLVDVSFLVSRARASKASNIHARKHTLPLVCAH